MATIHSYLTFNGNCREAMSFYKECLGGELFLQTVGESPMADKMPKEMQDVILHAMLSHKDLVLMGSDMVPESGLIKGNSVSMSVSCSSEKEIKTLYNKLSQGGKSTHPPENTFWGGMLGDLTDKYGNNWILHYERI